MTISVDGPPSAPQALIFSDGRRLKIEAVLDRWPGDDHLYLELLCEGGGRFIVRYDRREDRWELQVYRPDEEER